MGMTPNKSKPGPKRKKKLHYKVYKKNHVYKKVYSVTLNPKLVEALKDFAYTKELSFSNLVNHALESVASRNDIKY